MSDDLRSRIIGALTGRDRGLEDRLKSLNTGRVEILSVLADLRNSLQTQTAGQDKLRTDLMRINLDELTALRADVTTLRTGVITRHADVMARMDKLQDATTEIRDHIAIYFGNTEKVRQDDIGEVVAAKERQIRRLQAEIHAMKGEAP
jgi:hypothetical protein